MTVRLDGKVALVTGASRGVGKGIAVGLGEAGAEVWVTARTASPAAERAIGPARQRPVLRARSRRRCAKSKRRVDEVSRSRAI